MKADWVSAAARLPVAFAQVREDARLDSEVVAMLPGPARVLMVASGGCTAAALAAHANVASIHIVDPNPAQLALTRLKLALLAEEAPQRRALLGHAAMGVAERKQRLLRHLERLQLPPDALGDADEVALAGPDHAGRYENVFRVLRDALGPMRSEMEAWLQLSTPEEQVVRIAPQAPLGRALDAALVEVMSLPNLVGLFGEEATRNPVVPFDRHFAARIRHVAGVLPCRDNPYLWQMLAGRYPDGAHAPWLDERVPARTASVSWEVGAMLHALTGAAKEFDFVHISNILDWLSEERAREVLEAARHALAPGGCVFIRQLNSTLEIRRLGRGFAWRDTSSLAARDRSFFYRALHLGFPA